MIIPVNNKVLLVVEKEKDVEDHGGFKVVKTKKDSLLKGVVEGKESMLPAGTIVYFSAYGYEEIDGKVLVDYDQIWAYEQPESN